MSSNRRSRRLRQRRSFDLVQHLEDRSLLAGNVMAVVNGAGDLVLTGDAQSNAVDVVVIDNDLVVRGRDNTTINGGNTPFVVAAGSTNIRDDVFARLGRGDDDLFIEGAAVGGRVIADMGSGNDRLGLRDTTIGRSLVARTGTGDDGVSLSGVTIGQDLVVRTGRQSDVVSIAESTVQRNTSIATGIHDDSVVFNQATFNGFVHINTSEGHDNFVSMNSTVGRALRVAMGSHHDFALVQDTTVTGVAVIHTHGGADNLVIEGGSRFQRLVINTGRGGDNTQVDPAVTAARGIGIRRSETGAVTDSVQELRLNDATLGATTRANDLGDFFRLLSTTAAPLTLTVDTSGSGAVESNGTLVTNMENFTLQVATAPGATVAVDSDGDGNFDDAMATADASGNANLDVMLVHDATNNGANSLTVQASNDVDAPLTEQIDVHLATGTVVRFDSSLGSWDVELLDEDAPSTVGAFLDDLSRYDSSIFHRNVDEFIVQGGGFDVTAGGQVVDVTDFSPPPNEFNRVNPPNSNLRGTISTAQTSNINSFSGQWFFNTIDNDSTSPVNNLDSVPHVVFGEVIGTGMTIVDLINNTPVFNVSSLLAGSSRFALTDVPLVNYTQGNVPDDNNFIALNSVSVILTPPGTENTFRVFENTANAAVVGQLTPPNAAGDIIFDFDDANLPADLQLNPDDHLERNAAAPVVLIEYLSLQCPSCAAVQPEVAQLLADNPDDLLVVRRHNPLDVDNGGGFQHSFEAALAAEAAGRQGMFDEMVSQLFTRQADWDNSMTPQQAQAVFEDIAVNTLGLDLSQFNSDMADPVLTDRINRDIASAAQLNATGTPTFFLNGQLSTGTPSNTDVQEAAELLDRTFLLNRLSGELTVADTADLDFETNPTFTLDVRATNGVTDVFTATVNLIDIFAESP